MTAQEFTAFYPQFANFSPSVVLDTYVGQANVRFTDFDPADAEEARRLYAAHKLTMWCRTALPDGATPSHSAISNAGRAEAQISSKRVDDVQISYSTSSSSTARNSTGFADLSETNFGLQLLSLLRMYHMTKYIP